jgi:hypothetical protein
MPVPRVKKPILVRPARDAPTRHERDDERCIRGMVGASLAGALGGGGRGLTSNSELSTLFLLTP